MEVSVDEAIVEIPNHRGYYISKCGDVFSSVGSNGKSIRMLRPAVGTTGYLGVALMVGKRGKTYQIHRLMALTFLAPVAQGMDVNHKDGNKLNNDLSNLELCTRKGNMEHASKMGLCHFGEMNRSSKLKESEVLSIRRLCAAGAKQKEVGALYGVAQSCVSFIVNNKRWPKV